MSTRPFKFCGVYLFLTTAACTQATVVGSSGPDGEQNEHGTPAPSADEPAAADGRHDAPRAAAPKRPTLIQGSPRESFAQTPILGDLDGDGFDDFVLSFLEASPAEFIGSGFHLFYGRPSFPESLSTDAADASLRGEWQTLIPLGDINGDGLADVALKQQSALDILLGSRERVRGELSESAALIHWTPPTAEPFFADPSQTFMDVRAGGDVNCDGFDDVLLEVVRPLAIEEIDEDATNLSSAQFTYVMFGAPELPAGVWDPSWAGAYFAANDDSAGPPPWDIVGPAQPQAAGDLDGDGCGDLISSLGSVAFVFYGGSEAIQGRMGHADADAALGSSAAGIGGGAIGDLDRDGADDLILTGAEFETLSVVYSPNDRWSGNVELTPELTIRLDPSQRASVNLAIGDIDGIAGPELVFGLGLHGMDEDSLGRARGAMYVLRGGSERLRGTFEVDDAELLMVGPKPPELLEPPPVWSTAVTGYGLGASLSMSGDIDGDGSCDIVSSSPSAGAVYLIPSTPRSPD